MSSDPLGPLGTLFGGRYRLRGLLGVGGSAAVYEADDLRQQTADGPLRVAVKILHPHLCATQEARAAFLREAERVGHLRHPNIVAVRASGLHDSGGMTMAWIALDYVEGPTLAEWLETAGPLSPVAAAPVIRGVLAGLAEAHKEGLVHRDVSPRNVILEGAGTPGATNLEPPLPRILDFGLSDLTGRTTVGTDVLLSEGDDRGATGVVGNPDFMSPEQARGRAVTPAADLYQVGALLYFLLTGQAPYARGSVAQVLEAHITAPPPVPSALVSAARPLDRVVTRAMAKESEDRFPDAAAFLEAIDSALATGGATQVRHGATNNPTRVMALAARPELPGSARAEQHGIPLTSSPEPIPRSPAHRAVASAGPTMPAAPAQNTAGIVAVVAIVGLALLAVVSTFAAPAMSAHPLPSAEPTIARPSPSPAAPTPTHVVTRSGPSNIIKVPKLQGDLDAARRALLAAGLAVGQISGWLSPKPDGTVLSQLPKSGQLVPRGTAVEIHVASGMNKVPATAGLTVGAATAALEAAGFTAATNPSVADSSATVLSSEPRLGMVGHVGDTVTLILDDATPTATPTPTSTPTPSAP